MKIADELDDSEVTLPPLHQAARQRDVEKVQSLIASGASVNALDHGKTNGDGGNSPLAYAAQGFAGGGVAVAQLLVQGGADVNQRCKYGMTPLHLACSWGQADMVLFLHQHGADLNARDAYGRTPVSLARADYEEGKATPEKDQPSGFTLWLEGIAAINDYFDNREN